jgi:hypothetical protein
VFDTVKTGQFQELSHEFVDTNLGDVHSPFNPDRIFQADRRSFKHWLVYLGEGLRSGIHRALLDLPKSFIG